MLWPSRKRMTAKTTINTKLPIPNRGGFRPPGTIEFELVVIRAASPPGQAPAMGPPFIVIRHFPCRCSNYITPPTRRSRICIDLDNISLDDIVCQVDLAPGNG